MKKFDISKVGFVALRILIALVIIFVCAFTAIPTKPPFSLQSFAVFFVSFLLVPSEAFLTLIIYLLLGAVGVPIFAEVSGGLQVLLGMSGGYLFSFPIIAFISSKLMRKKEPTFKGLIIIFSLMTLIIYVFGTTWIMVRNLYDGSLWKVILTCTLPFVPLDALKIFAISKIIIKIREKTKKDAKNNT